MNDRPTTTTQSGWKPMLEARLYRNLKATPSWNPEHTALTLTVPTRKPGYLFPPISWIVRPPESKRIELDAIGGQLWEWCDGKRNVEQVIELFARKHNLTFHESRVSVTTYLRELLKRGALAVAI